MQCYVLWSFQLIKSMQRQCSRVGRIFLRWKINCLAHKRAGEAWGGPNIGALFFVIRWIPPLMPGLSPCPPIGLPQHCFRHIYKFFLSTQTYIYTYTVKATLWVIGAWWAGVGLEAHQRAKVLRTLASSLLQHVVAEARANIKILAGNKTDGEPLCGPDVISIPNPPQNVYPQSLPKSLYLIPSKCLSLILLKISIPNSPQNRYPQAPSK